MLNSDPKKRRIKFNWQDAVAILVVAVATAGIFTWTYFITGSKVDSNAYLVVKYQNNVLSDKIVIIDSDQKKYDYSISFRRSIGKSETVSYEDSSSYTKVEMDVLAFKDITDFTEYDNKYIIVTSSGYLDDFASLQGPQLDISISNGGFKISKETSPNHVCSNQGFVNKENYPVVCLPNSFYCSIVIGDGSSYDGPDA